MKQKALKYTYAMKQKALKYTYTMKHFCIFAVEKQLVALPLCSNEVSKKN
jgi:hypothetical protein